MKQREGRRKLLLKTKICDGANWMDACIVNASSRGLGMQALRPPSPGTYVEIRNSHSRIVARIIWVKGHRFGVRTQDIVDMAAISANRPVTGHSEAKCSPAQPIRRADTKKSIQAMAERSRASGHWMEFVSVVVALIAIGLLLQGALQRAFALPMSEIRAKLG